jgi:hypothetical protein
VHGQRNDLLLTLFSNTLFHRIVQLLEKGILSECRRIGRPSALSPQAVVEMQEERREDDMARNSADKKALVQKIQEKRQEVAKANNQNDLGVVPLCPKTAMKYVHQIAPDTCNKPSTQNLRRFDALQRPVNHVSTAAVWGAIAFDQDGDTLLPTIEELDMHNFDNTAILLRSVRTQSKKLYCAAGSIKALKKLRLSPARTTKEKEETFQQRCVHVTLATTAAGSISCAVIKIKDKRFRKFNQVLTVKLCHCPSLPYRVYLQAIPYITAKDCRIDRAFSSGSHGIDRAFSSCTDFYY